jgi:hypothetical protein
MKFRLEHEEEREWPPVVPDGVVLGRLLSGESALPVRDSAVIWPFEQLRYHAILFGDSDSGRTETALRMAHDIAEKTGGPIFCLDAGDDAELADRFAAVMGSLGRRVHVFPDEPFDGWRGDHRAVANRLSAAAGFERDKGRAESLYETELANVALQYACRLSAEPRSSAELLTRLEYDWLAAVDPDLFGDGSEKVIERVRRRMRALFDGLDGALDGDRYWDDFDAAYFRIGGRHSLGAHNLVRFFLEDWMHYLRNRGTADEPSLMLLSGLREDLISGQDLKVVQGQAKMSGAGVVSTWDSPADIGSERNRKILLGALWTVIVHRTNRPEGIADQAGERKVPETETVQGLQDGEFRTEYLMRNVSRPVLIPRDFADLPDGTAWVIQRGQAAKVAIESI